MPDRQSPRQKPPSFKALTNGDFAQIERMYIEEAGRFRGITLSGSILMLIRSEEVSQPEEVERIFQAKFDLLPDELTQWLDEVTPGLTRCDLYDLAEAAFQADFMSPLDIIRRFEMIPRRRG